MFRIETLDKCFSHGTVEEIIDALVSISFFISYFNNKICKCIFSIYIGNINCFNVYKVLSMVFKSILFMESYLIFFNDNKENYTEENFREGKKCDKGNNRL